MGTTTERLSVLETKVDELVSQTTRTNEKVDLILETLNKGNFDERIGRIDVRVKKVEENPYKWVWAIAFTVLGSVLTFLLISFLKNPTM